MRAAGTRKPEAAGACLREVLASLAAAQRSVVLMLQGGERHHLKLLEVREGVVVGEARCLYHNYDIGRRIHQHAMEEEKKCSFSGPGGAVMGLTMADAVEKFGKDAHRYRFYIALEQVSSVAEDVDDAFDETPFFPGLI